MASIHRRLQESQLGLGRGHLNGLKRLETEVLNMFHCYHRCCCQLLLLLLMMMMMMTMTTTTTILSQVSSGQKNRGGYGVVKDLERRRQSGVCEVELGCHSGPSLPTGVRSSPGSGEEPVRAQRSHWTLMRFEPITSIPKH